jgi:hypothetical protein
MSWILPPEDEPFPEIQRRKLSSNQIWPIYKVISKEK